MREMSGKVKRVLVKAWRDFLSIYYANTVVWRLFKSGALVFLGIFCWIGGNLMLSYKPGWTWLNYLMAYGIFLIFYGPFTHVVVVPLSIKMRKRGVTGVKKKLVSNASKINITVFIIIVILLGTFFPGAIALDFDVGGDGSGTPDIDPELVCTQGASTVGCELSNSTGVDHVVVGSGGEVIRRLEEPPFRFELKEGELAEVVGQRQFTVELRDENDETVRRFRRNPRF